MWVRTFKEEGTAQMMALRLEHSGKGELMIWWAEDMAEQVSVSALPSALLPPAPLCVNPKLPAPRLTFLSPQTGLCTAPNLWGWCPLSTKCSLLSLTLERGPSTLQCRGSGARPPEFIV